MLQPRHLQVNKVGVEVEGLRSRWSRKYRKYCRCRLRERFFWKVKVEVEVKVEVKVEVYVQSGKFG